MLFPPVRFGFGEDGKDLVPETTVRRGHCIFHTNGDMHIKGDVYSAAATASPASASAVTSTAVASDTEARRAFDLCATATAAADGDPEAEQFTAMVRRLHTHVNSYNPIIQYCTRSNMDLKVLLRDSDARGLLFYILNYSTKTEQTLDVLLPLLVPVVERIRDESDGAPAKEVAVRLVRSCLCRQLSSLNIGVPAAASKVLGLDDHKISHTTINCPMAPLLAWASSKDGPLDCETNDGDNESNSDDSDDDDDEDDDDGVVIAPVKGKLTFAKRAHLLYRNRCKSDDTDHPLHGMCFFMWHKLVRVEKFGFRGNIAPDGADVSDGELSGEDDEGPNDDGDSSDDSPLRKRHPQPNPKRGRPRTTRYPFVGVFKKEWQQVRSTETSLPSIQQFDKYRYPPITIRYFSPLRPENNIFLRSFFLWTLKIHFRQLRLLKFQALPC